MPDSFLLIDIGNTSLKIGTGTRQFSGSTYSLPTRAQHTSDSLGLSLLQLLTHARLEAEELEACLICSVVPSLDPLFRQACKRFLRKTPLFFPEDFSIKLENRYRRPEEVGADRLLAAFAARRLYPDPPSLISVDFGTATTFDCVSGNAYLGGLICPGVLSSHAALSGQTAKLPRISLEVDAAEPRIGRSTATSLSHGFVFGFAAMASGLCTQLKAQLPGPTEVVATGGFAADLSRVCTCFDHVRPDLILEGLRLAWLESQA